MIVRVKSLLFDQYRCLKLLGDTGKKYLTQDTKSPLRRYWEAQRWLWTNDEFCVFYNAWGLNGRNARPDDFIGRKEFLRLKAAAESKLKVINGLNDLQYDVLTKDKFVAGSFMEGNGIPCVRHHGIIVKGKFLSTGSRGIELEELLNYEGDLFFKNVALEASDGILHVRGLKTGIIVDGQEYSWPEAMNRFTSGVWLVQSRLTSHASIREISSSALNTTRIVTIISGSEPFYLNGFQAFANANSKTDSWSEGSVYVGIDVVNGCLKKYGIYHPADPANSMSTYHPDSKIAFEGYKVPFLGEAVKLCIRAHRLLYNNFIIGWDVAITDRGPVIVEANEKPGMNAVQCLDGGCRKKILASYNELIFQ